MHVFVLLRGKLEELFLLFLSHTIHFFMNASFFFVSHILQQTNGYANVAPRFLYAFEIVSEASVLQCIFALFPPEWVQNRQLHYSQASHKYGNIPFS